MTKVTNRVAFGPSHIFFQGASEPSIAMNNSTAVVAYTGVNNATHIMGASLLSWPDVEFTNASSSMANTTSPSIGITNANMAVLAYIDSSGVLCYRTGKVESNLQIHWYNNGQPVSSTPNQNPNPNILHPNNCSIAVSEQGQIVIVMEKTDSSDNTKKLWYIRGSMNNADGSVTWQSSHYYIAGIRPRVAINSDNYVLEVHQSESYDSTYYTLWTLGTSDGKLTERDSDEYNGDSLRSPSKTPSICMNSHGYVLEVHETGASFDNSLYYIQFQINTSAKTLDHQHEQRYSLKATTDGMGGTNPTVALNDQGFAIQMYQSEDGDLYGSLTQLWDRSNWMSEYGSYTLRRLSIPGSHDAGMWDASHCTVFASSGNTVTQIMPIKDQLDVGIRYFDIRPVLTLDNQSNVSKYRTGHFSAVGSSDPESTFSTSTFDYALGCQGEDLDKVLSGVGDFLSLHPTEVVILKFSHYVYHQADTYRFFNNTDVSVQIKQTLIDRLINYIAANLDPATKIFTKGNARLVDTEISLCKGKVIIVFDIADLAGVSLSNTATNNIYSYLDYDPDGPSVEADMIVFDKYTNTNEVDTMKSQATPSTDYERDHPGQEYLLKTSKYHGGDLFLLSWTLTLQGQQLVNPAAYDIKQLSQNAGGILSKQLVAMKKNYMINSTCFPHIIYVDSADGFATDVCKWVNSLFLK
jgi:hypothetical protein